MISIFKKNRETVFEKELKAFSTGCAVPIEEVPDEIFSTKMMGDGLAIIPENEVVAAPAGGDIILVMKESKHACGMKLLNGIEILIHVGLDTVEMKGEGFKVFVKEGDRVKQGDPLIKFDQDKIIKAGHTPIIIMVITDPAGNKIDFNTGMHVKSGETMIASVEKQGEAN